jgi:uncharacterized protein (DUF697 family)
MSVAAVKENLAPESEPKTETEADATATRRDEANSIVRNYALGSIVPSLMPVPMLDLGLVTAIQLKMLHSLANTYGVPFREELSRSAITALIGGTVALSMARVMSSAVKVIPGVGSIVGMASMPVVNGGTTYAIGKVFVQHFESGGTFLTFDPSKVREYFEKELAQGKSIIAAAQTNGEAPKA